MTKHVEQRLENCFRAVAEQVVAEPVWERVVDDAAGNRRCGSTSRLRLGAAVAAAVFVVVGGYLVLDRSPSTTVAVGGSSFVLPGETVVSTDPLVVLPAPAAEANFATSELGEQVVIEPMTELTPDALRSIEVQVSLMRPATITKITLLGTLEGHPLFGVVTDGPPPEGSPFEGNYRERWVVSDDSGGGSGGPADPGSLEMMGPDHEFSSGLGYATPVGDMIWGVPLETAVVTFESDDVDAWMIPTGGYALFWAEFDPGERVTLTALDANGEVVGRSSVTAEDDFDPSIGPQVGDRLDRIEATELDGTPLVVDSGDRPTVLLFGADWCVPCGLVAEQGLTMLDASNSDPQVFIVPSYTQPGERWNLGDGWDQPQIRLEPDLGGIQQVPTVIILDADNTIVSVAVGANDVLDALAITDELSGGSP